MSDVTEKRKSQLWRTPKIGKISCNVVHVTRNSPISSSVRRELFRH